MIRTDGLRKSYGPLVAVDGVSLEVRPGETFGLLGPNGAGKTTLLHLLGGALAPDGGTLDIAGAGSPADPAVRRRIGVAPQVSALYGPLTGEENVRFFGRLQGLAGEALARRTAEVLDRAGLADRRRDRVDTYSGGMKRRLNLACALVHDPPLLLLDEPTVGVDPQSRNRIFEDVERLRREGRCVVYTTHYMEEAQRLCDRVAILDRGRVLALGTPEELIDRHGGRSVVRAGLDRPPAAGAALPGCLEGTTLLLETDRPFEALAALAAAAEAAGVRLVRVQIDRPDLEAVFLAVTGRSLRDE
jgi:ABC-2 type transport system ATP-binding protein